MSPTEDDKQEKVVTLDEGLAMAMELHQNGRLAEAKAIYTTILNADAQHPGALHYLGLLHHQSGEAEKAVELIRKALAINPEYTHAYNNLGNILRLQGRMQEAEEAYQKVIDLLPEHSGALNNLAAIYKEQNRLEEAIATYERAASAEPNQASIHHNLGNALRKQGKLEDALAAYQRAVELDPEHSNAYQAMGRVLDELEREDESEAAFTRAIEIDAKNATAHFGLGERLISKGLIEDALISYERALAINPRYSEVYERAAWAYYIVQEPEKQLALLRRWIEFEPDSAAARHMLAAAMGEDVPDRASDEYMQHLFDSFSESFDRQLQRLEYQAPQLLVQRLEDAGIAAGTRKAILDAGCGTGLCGPLLAPYVDRLVGVDLSAGMLERARERGVYDDLVQAELTAYLLEHPAEFDVIICADTFVYFGSLDDALSASFNALRSPGLLAFSVEIAPDENEAGFQINPHGRYSHTRRYVEQTLASVGFTDISMKQAVLRREAEKEVRGWITFARRGD